MSHNNQKRKLVLLSKKVSQENASNSAIKYSSPRQISLKSLKPQHKRAGFKSDISEIQNKNKNEMELKLTEKQQSLNKQNFNEFNLFATYNKNYYNLDTNNNGQTLKLSMIKSANQPKKNTVLDFQQEQKSYIQNNNNNNNSNLYQQILSNKKQNSSLNPIFQGRYSVEQEQKQLQQLIESQQIPNSEKPRKKILQQRRGYSIQDKKKSQENVNNTFQTTYQKNLNQYNQKFKSSMPEINTSELMQQQPQSQQGFYNNNKSEDPFFKNKSEVQSQFKQYQQQSQKERNSSQKQQQYLSKESQRNSEKKKSFIIKKLNNIQTPRKMLNFNNLNQQDQYYQEKPRKQFCDFQGDLQLNGSQAETTTSQLNFYTDSPQNQDNSQQQQQSNKQSYFYNTFNYKNNNNNNQNSVKSIKRENALQYNQQLQQLCNNNLEQFINSPRNQTVKQSPRNHLSPTNNNDTSSQNLFGSNESSPKAGELEERRQIREKKISSFNLETINTYERYNTYIDQIEQQESLLKQAMKKEKRRKLKQPPPQAANLVF